MPRARLRPHAAPSLALALLLMGACGGGGSTAGPAHTPAATDSKYGTLKGYDAEGNSIECAPPQEQCEGAKVNADFKDRCRLLGYRLMRCGCEDACSGNVKKDEKFFDSAGKEKSCAPEQEGCTPTETSAKFQDACTDARHKLVVCGCEWLCNGPFTAGKSSPSE